MNGQITVVFNVFLNLFMKKFTRGRVVPTISASVSWLICVVIGSVLPLLAEIPHEQSWRQ